MQLTDVSVSPLIFKMELVANSTESGKEANKIMDEHLMEAFTVFLEDQNLVSRSVSKKPWEPGLILFRVMSFLDCLTFSGNSGPMKFLKEELWR